MFYYIIFNKCFFPLDTTKEVKRHASVGGEQGFGDNSSNVLRKVASLTLDRATTESKVAKTRLVPDKLDLRSCEKFEGILSKKSLFYPLGISLRNKLFKLV